MLLAAFAAYGCQDKGTSSSEAKNPGPGRGGGSSGEPDRPIRTCRSIEVVEVLPDAGSAISRLNENSWILWDLESRSSKAEGVSFNLIKSGGTGKYIVSKISERKYQLMRLEGGDYRRQTVFLLDSMSRPRFSVREKAGLLAVRHRPYSGGGRDRIDIYNVQREEFIFSLDIGGVEFAQLSADAKSLIVGFDHGFDREVVRYDLASKRPVYKIELPLFRSFSYMKTAAGRIVAKSGSIYYVYDLEDGSLLYQSRYDHFYEIDSASGYGLAAKGWNEVAIVDLKDGAELFAGAGPEQAVLSSCRVGIDPLRLVCKDKEGGNKVLMWNVRSGKASNVCY